MITANDILLLLEKRRNPELNPKLDLVTALSKYKDDPDVYISFRTINKIGMNPNSKYSTPNGIYTYPLALMWNELVKDRLPFASDPKKTPYVYVIKPKNDKSFLKDMEIDYTEKMFKRDVEKIKQIWIKSGKPDLDTGTDIFDNYEDFVMESNFISRKGSPIGKFWNLTRLYSNNIRGFKSQQWNNLFRKLGYSGFADTINKGIIHPNEPTQAVFLSKDVFDVLEVVKNVRHEGLTGILDLLKGDPNNSQSLQDVFSAGMKGLTFPYLPISNVPITDKIKRLRTSLPELGRLDLVIGKRDKKSGKDYFNFKLTGKGNAVMRVILNSSNKNR